MKAIRFRRGERAGFQIGFEADNLPRECFALQDDGTRSEIDVYTSAVIGVLAAQVGDLTARIAELEGKKK